jgi:hypothetical protein
VQVAVRASQLVFLQRGSAPYRLVVGRAGAHSAALPLTTLIPAYQPQRLQQLGRAELLAEATLSTRLEATAAAGGDWKRWGLWAVLLLGVGMLALMAISLLRRPAAG